MTQSLRPVDTSGPDPTPTPAPAAMLAVRGLRAAYGRIEVLHGLDMTVADGETVAIVGANGAGKTTLLRCLSGVQPLSAGEIHFRGRPLARVPAHDRVALGLAHSPEGRQIFSDLTVEDNLRLGAYRADPATVPANLEHAYTLFPMLRDKRSMLAGGLSGGQQQMLAISRALMANPTCLLLDEPSMGLAPALVDDIFAVIAGLKARGITVVLVEQNAYGALAVADRAYVLESGRIAMDGRAAELIHDERIRTAYLGL